MYIAVLEDVPDFMVPTLVAHTVLNAHLEFEHFPLYKEWLHSSFRKVVVKVNKKEFDKIKALECVIGRESTVLDGQQSCAVLMPVFSDSIPNVLKFAKTWKPS